jgi:sugar lactone lactonase YvrE
MDLELVFFANLNLVESPVWDKNNKYLYFVAINECIIFRLNSITGEVSSILTHSPVGCIQLKDDDIILSAEQDGIFEIYFPENKRKYLGTFLTDNKMRYNDGKLDANGRFLVGTKGHLEEFIGEGKLISFEKDKFNVLVENTTISNGLGFSKDNSILYFIDTPTKKVGSYFYDIRTGSANFDRFIIQLTEDGVPDGMCVDIDDMIWIAEWGGGKVCKWNPFTGVKLLEIRLPCKNVTSCCLGGKDLNYLYITTAKSDIIDDKFGGGVFRIKIR